MARVIKKKSSITYKEVQSFIGFFLFAAKVIYLGQQFFRRFYDALAKGKKYLY